MTMIVDTKCEDGQEASGVKGGGGGEGGGERDHRPHRPVAHARVLEELG